LCAAVPALPLALCAERLAVEAFLAGGESRAHALVREGRVELEAPSPEELGRRLEALGVRHPEALSTALSQLAEDGASDELLTRFGQAAREREVAATGELVEADRARSAAERFLRLLLEELPDTQGLFELNERTEFRINNRPVEVDFLSRRLRVAIELDGYYHFRDMEAYRRDRRKDLALQRHGYLVLRFLADDVVARFRERRDTLQ
jgi:very-short-patch-repair endonuclease